MNQQFPILWQYQYIQVISLLILQVNSGTPERGAQGAQRLSSISKIIKQSLPSNHFKCFIYFYRAPLAIICSDVPETDRPSWKQPLPSGSIDAQTCRLMVPSHAHDIFPMVFSILLKIICIINFDNKHVLTIMVKLVLV